ncbi:MAG: DUF2079 domain-containing protein [Chloroflexota bacterium]
MMKYQTFLKQASSLSKPLIGILFGFNLFFISYSFQKHAAFQTNGFDLGIWDQMTWNTLQGRPFWLTQHSDTINGLSDHVELILLLIFPLYGLYNGPELLLILQSLLASLGALPIYWFAKSRLGTEKAGLVFASVYLLYPALGAALTFDVHSLTIAVPLLTYALWAMYMRYYRLFITMACLALICKEDISLLIFMMGLYILLQQRAFKLGLMTMVGALTWFFIAVFVIIPFFREGESEYIYRYNEWGDTISQIMINVTTQPWRVLQVIFEGDKLLYWIRFTMPVFFTALLDPLTLLLAAPLMLINTLGNYPAAYQLDLFHNSAPLAAYVVFASINGVVRIIEFAKPRLKHVRPGFLQNLLLIMVFVVTLVYQFQFGHTPIGRYFNWPIVTNHHQTAKIMLDQIPPQASVASQNNLAPRLSHRPWLFVLPTTGYQEIEADYIAMDLEGNFDHHGSLVRFCDQLNELLGHPEYGLIFAEDGLLLFQRGVSDSATFEPRSPCL